MLAVRKDKENTTHILLAGFVADEDDHFADTIHRSLEDGLHLPHAVLVVTPIGLRKPSTTSLVGEVAVKLAGSGLGKTGAADGAGAEGAGGAGRSRCGAALPVSGGCRRGRYMLLGYGLEHRNE